MKVWITKYALSKGIIVAEALVHDYNPRGITVRSSTGTNPSLYFFRPHWHESETDALVRVADMVERRLAAIDRELKKLQGLNDKLSRGELPISRTKL